jgi:hypothetical protein
VYSSKTSKGQKGGYPEEAIHKAGFDEKPENIPHTLRGTTLSERSHSSAVFPGERGRGIGGYEGG